MEEEFAALNLPLQEGAAGLLLAASAAAGGLSL